MDISNKEVKDTKSLENRKYIRFDSGVEKIPENEAEDVQAVADQINAIQMATWNKTRHCFSGTEIASLQHESPLITIQGLTLELKAW